MNRFLRWISHSGYLVPSALTGYLWLKGQWHHLPGWECPFLAITGIPCPGCYLTRATSAALNLQWQQSVDLHAFGPIVAAGFLVWSIRALRTKKFMPPAVPLSTIAWGLLALLLYWIVRFLGTSYGLSGPFAFP
ncbi:MAG: DUF2752 domain-containing protein [Synechococcus sp.]